MTIAEAVSYGAKVLQDNEVVEPRRESALLLTLATGKDRAFLIAHPEAALDRAEEQKFREYIERRASHEPFQYISGHQEFFGLDFSVSPDVLIPRPETEAVVEASIEVLRDKHSPEFLEVGVGSGCISVSILDSLKKARGVAGDVSQSALRVAAGNAAIHGVDDRLEFLISDVFESIGRRRFDLVVSNPPYVPFDDLNALQPEVRDFEPVNSLSDGRDGLSIIRRLVEGSPDRLKKGGWLILEIGFSQSAAVAEMFNAAVWKEFEMLPDLQGIPRIVRAAIS
jgi:release factor glutamine methyltransferase